MKLRTKVSIADIIVCFAVIALATASLLIMKDTESKTVEVITKDSTLLYDLRKDVTEVIVSNGYELTIEIKNGSARILSSTCPDKVCENSGWTDDVSRPIICAPAEVIVRIKSTEGGVTDADFIAGR